MRNWSRRRFLSAVRSWLALSLLLLLVAALATLFGDAGTVLFVTSLFILCMMVVALQTFIGNSGIVSFGNLAFFATGAYTTAIVTMPPDVKLTALPALPLHLQQIQLGLIAAVVVGALAAGLLALVTGVFLTRMPSSAMAMATLALLVVVHTTINNWKAVTRGTIGIYGIPRNVTLTNALIGVILVVGVALLYKASPAGLRLQATREDELAARSLGIACSSERLAGWIMGALLMGAGGSFWAQNVLAFGPDTFFFRDTFNMLAMLVIGGQASVTGAVAGTFAVSLLGELLRPLESGLLIGTVQLPRLDGIVHFSVALLILGVLILRPSGLLNGWELTLPRWSTLRRRWSVWRRVEEERLPAPDQGIGLHGVHDDEAG